MLESVRLTMAFVKHIALFLFFSVCLGCFPGPYIEQQDYCRSEFGMSMYIFWSFFPFLSFSKMLKKCILIDFKCFDPLWNGFWCFDEIYCNGFLSYTGLFSPSDIFAPLYLQTVSLRLEYAQTKWCLKIDNFKHRSSSNFKSARWQRGQTERNKNIGGEYFLIFNIIIGRTKSILKVSYLGLVFMQKWFFLYLSFLCILSIWGKHHINCRWRSRR